MNHRTKIQRTGTLHTAAVSEGEDSFRVAQLLKRTIKELLRPFVPCCPLDTYDTLLSYTMATDPSVEPMPLSSARFTLEVLVVRWKCLPVYECKSSARVAS